MAPPKKTKPYKHVRSVEVHLWGQHMGSVALDPAYGFYAFSYTPDFTSQDIEPSALSMRADPGQVPVH